jgi:hypothetical protein
MKVSERKRKSGAAPLYVFKLIYEAKPWHNTPRGVLLGDSCYASGRWHRFLCAPRFMLTKVWLIVAVDPYPQGNVA